MFSTSHKVQFYETDLMGIVHHANYLRFYEEARVAWAHAKGLIDYQKPGSAARFAVLETQVKHHKPTFFGDELVIRLQAKLVGVRIIFEYEMRVPARENQIVSVGRTTHVALDTELKPMRPLPAMLEILEKEQWTETWLSNL